MCLPRPLLALLVLSAALLATACGGSDAESRKLIAESRSEALLRNVDRVDAALADEDCAGARTEVDRLRGRVEDLPEATDGKLVTNLTQWVDHLESRLTEDCEAAEEATPTPSATATPEESATPTETPTPDETPTPSATPDETATPAPTTTPAEPEAPSNGGAEPGADG